MRKKFFLLVGLLGVWGIGYGQSRIKTVRCYPEGRSFAEPVIELGTGQQLNFSFDDLSDEQQVYTYKIVHCDPDWNPSGLSPFHYLTGFFNNPIDQYEYSMNTRTEYIHFSLKIPNEEVGIKLSGNYLLQVFNEENPDSAVVCQRFSVLENKTTISANVSHTTLPHLLNTSQQVDFSVAYGNLAVHHLEKDIRVFVTRNQDPNTRKEFKPVFVRQNQLVYGDGRNNVFDGLSPFRNFSCASLVYNTRYVKDVLRGPDGRYHFVLKPGEVPRRYVPLPDRNGNFDIEAENVLHPDIEADYVAVHFAVLCPKPIPDAEVYVYGKFSDWKCLPAMKMTYDDKNRAYVGEAEVKQGYYDYMYAVVPNSSENVNLTALQNNFYQNPNRYQIRVYYYDYDRKCFRFVGYREVSAGI